MEERRDDGWHNAGQKLLSGFSFEQAMFGVQPTSKTTDLRKVLEAEVGIGPFLARFRP
jgi:hypothetical protein